MLDRTLEVARAYGAEIAASPGPLLLALVLGGLAGAAYVQLRRRVPQPTAAVRQVASWLPWIALSGLGLRRVFDRAAVFDDAYISLAYARHLVAGDGLVFNPGERVEGYTNFLWTLLLAGAMALTDVDPPLLALGGCVLCYVGNLLALRHLSGLLAAESGPRGLGLPIAVGLLALQPVFVSYGTSGLETGLSCLLVVLGLSALVAREGAASAAAAGVLLVLATLTRPDHGLFYAVGGLVLAAEHAPPALRVRAAGLRAMWAGGLRPLSAYAAAFLPYLAYLAWKLSYYGAVLPNTYYAKSADRAYWSQGLSYVAEFLFSSQLLWTLPVFALWLRLPAATPRRRRFRRFVLLAVPVYVVYVAKVGDFMRGRFFVSLLPLIFLALEDAIVSRSVREGRRALLATALAAALTATTFAPVALIGERRVRWGIADESDFYQVVAWAPIEIDHFNFRVARVLRQVAATGHELRIANKTVGMIGYYVDAYVLDRRGLTDAHVAHLPLRRRGRPGHEKLADDAYVRSREVQFIDGGHVPRRFRAVARVRWGPGTGSRVWHAYRYQRQQVAAMRALGLGIELTDFERYLDGYIGGLSRHAPAKVAQDLAWFRSYYFDHNEDPARLQALIARASQAGGAR